MPDTGAHERALARFRSAESAESKNRLEGVEDLRFLNGDQWPTKIKEEREREDRPCETINKLPGHVDQILGEIRQNKLSIKVRPTGKPSSKAVAEIFEGLIRSIEYLSRSDTAYKTGAEGAASSGRGAWRIITDFVDDDVFDQEIRIKRIKNPYTVYFDPSAEEWDKRDGKWAFITQWIPEDEYKVTYPNADISSFARSAPGDTQKMWYDSKAKFVRVAEYFEKQPVTKTILLLSDNRVVERSQWYEMLPKLQEREEVHWTDERGVIQIASEDNPPPPGATITKVNPVPEVVRERTVESHNVVSYIINGIDIISGPHPWAGKYIPIVPVWGKEINIDGVDHVRGQVRFAKGPQRMYNYERNAEIEQVALAKKPPTRLTPQQIEGHTQYWQSDANYKYQLYNHVPGQPPPIDVQPPGVSSGNVAQAATSADEIKATTQVFDASIGARSNETSGIAIHKRIVQGGIANYTYLDNLVRSIQYTGDILVDLIPKIYDTERCEIVLGEDYNPKEVTINEEVDGKILNDLSLGKYMVHVDVGPHYTTKRMETATNLIELAGVVPAVGQVGADLIVLNMDFKGSDELAKRLKRVIPKEVLEDEPTDKKPSLESIEKQVEIKGKQLDNVMKELGIAKDSIEMRRFMHDVAQGAAAGAMQQVVSMLNNLNGPTGGANAGVE